MDIKSEVSSVQLALEAHLALEALTKHDASRNQLPELCAAKPLFHIDTNGHWHYLDSPLPDKFARLFMSVLRPLTLATPETEPAAKSVIGDDGGERLWELVTPIERVRVSVALAPVMIVDFEHNRGQFRLTSVLGHEYYVGSEAIELNDCGGRIHLENGLFAAMNRACYYRFAELIIEE